MRTFLDAKPMAKALRDALKDRQIDISHSDGLELVARQFGFDNWNILAAKIGEKNGGAPATAAGDIVFDETVPILRIFSIDKAREFYVDWLGFSVDWEHRFHDGAPLYMQVSRGDLKLHLSEHHGDATPGSTVFVYMRGIETLHRELIGKNYRHNRPGLETPDWGRQVEVADPFNNRIRFCEPKETR